MIRVSVLMPGGNLFLTIDNDKTGSDSLGNYVWNYRKDTGERANGRLIGYTRSRGAMSLITEVGKQIEDELAQAAPHHVAT